MLSIVYPIPVMNPVGFGLSDVVPRKILVVVYPQYNQLFPYTGIYCIYCIDVVVDTQVQQVATVQTLRNSKVAAPDVLFYFLFLSTRKAESPC